MRVSREELEQRFRELDDDALLRRLRDGTLTSLALEVATAELQSRGIGLSDVQSTRTAGDDQAENEDVDLVTVAQFHDPLQANVLRACLESHGIFAYIWGEHLGIAHVFMSIASGGMRVQVRSDQLAAAQNVIAAFERGDFAIDEAPE